VTQPDGRGPGDEDELWRAIVDHYGDRAEIPAEGVDGAFAGALSRPAAADQDADPDVDPPDDPGERFVPLPTPPVPIPQGPRLAAWVGIFAVPLFLVLVIGFRVWVPALISYALLAWFIGGFTYLVVSMPRGPRDPWDDGAQV
jgi:hypothetical protein